MKLTLKQVKQDLKNPIFKKCSTLSYSIGDLTNRSKLDMNVTLSNGKDLQRKYVWTSEQQQAYIIAILRGVQTTNLTAILYDPEDGTPRTFKIIDGKQRLTTLIKFIQGKISIIFECKVYDFNDLDDDCQRMITSRFMLIDIYNEYPDTPIHDDDYITLFEQINFTGTRMDLKHLNDLKFPNNPHDYNEFDKIENE